jgi:SAM-dependent methyltransferase
MALTRLAFGGAGASDPEQHEELNVKAEDYEAWYGTARGRWIAEREYALLNHALAPRPAEILLDVGCGTGHFTRRFAANETVDVMGLDPNIAWLQFAARNHTDGERFIAGDAIALPFADHSFDLTVSVTALCFIRDQRKAISELVRVTRRRFALGLLHRGSPLYLKKGRHGGLGAYKGAHWHTLSEAKALFAGQPVRNLHTQTVLASTSGSRLARLLESLLPTSWPWGSFLVVSGDIERTSTHRAENKKRHKPQRNHTNQVPINSETGDGNVLQTTGEPRIDPFLFLRLRGQRQGDRGGRGGR